MKMGEGEGKIGVLFVCLGNICRSPTAEGVFRRRAHDAGLASSLVVDSAGCAGYHVGEAPDPRTREAALRRGYDLSGLRARKIEARDFARFDYVLCADRDNLTAVTSLAEGKLAGGMTAKAEIDLFLRFAKGASTLEIPDPYYGGAAGFEHVIDLCEAASDGLLDVLRARIAA